MSRSSVFEDIPNEIVVFIEFGQVVVSASFNADQRDAVRVDPLQRLAVLDGDESV